MELSKFITDVLKEIQTGVKNANEKKELLHIAQRVRFYSCCDNENENNRPIDYINFDVALTSNSGKKESIEVLFSSDETKEKTVQTKVNFRIPIYWETKELENARKKSINNSIKN
jgi:hypothetical protein